LLQPGSTYSFDPAKSVGIAINDKTRPVPHDVLLPPLLDILMKLGIATENITFYIATGTHFPMTREEISKIVPFEIFENYKILNHNCDSDTDNVFLGITHLNTPVYVNKHYQESKIKIVVGNIEPHHYMGFSGGVKSAAIGLAARATINANHSHLIDPDAKAANYYSNPCRKDVEEIGKMMGIDYALNVILNTEKQIIKALWGNPVVVMKKGIELSAEISRTIIERPFDIVIASAGGYPKDINLYQAQKALTNAAEITKDGGDVYLVAACDEGAGNSDFYSFLEDARTPAEIIKKFREVGFSVGPHKAFQIARIAERVNIHLISNMPDDLSSHLLFSPSSITNLEKKINSLSISKTLAFMPYAVTTIPKLQEKNGHGIPY
jgi:nickel-dependent lactate racemase